MPDAPIRSTTAGSSPPAALARRQRRYLISMGIRVLCFIGAVIAGIAGVNWLWPILVGGALILPYVAVVMANAGAAPDPPQTDFAYQRDRRALSDRPADTP